MGTSEAWRCRWESRGRILVSSRSAWSTQGAPGNLGRHGEFLYHIRKCLYVYIHTYNMCVCIYTYICIYVHTHNCFSQKDLRGFVTTQEDYATFTERQQNELKNSVLLLYTFICGGSKLRATGVCGQINTHYLAEVPSHSPLWTRILQPSFMSPEQRGNSGCVYGLKCPQWVVKDSRQKFCGCYLIT